MLTVYKSVQINGFSDHRSGSMLKKGHFMSKAFAFLLSCSLAAFILRLLARKLLMYVLNLFLSVYQGHLQTFLMLIKPLIAYLIPTWFFFLTYLPFDWGLTLFFIIFSSLFKHNCKALYQTFHVPV